MEHRNAAATAGIETVVVDPEAVIAAFERNRDEDAVGRRHVLRVSPPLDGEKRAELTISDDEATDRAAGATPLDLPPELFVENYRGDDPERTTVRIPTREDARRAARVDGGDDVDEATVEEYLEREMDVWRDCVRDSLVPEVRAAVDPDSGTEVWVDVSYR
ncbi:hypothetical protein [Halostella litorea]|uniref:hypothetical protein n=1 Tax=Halostella litorea TaxID=2528831 RepID=UPI001091A0CE|nr:hypothetical protein [Halostella litorea]